MTGSDDHVPSVTTSSLISNQFLNLNKEIQFSTISQGEIKENIINLNEFPLNLIPDVQMLLLSAVIFYTVILNVKIVEFIISKNFIKYIPNNRFGNILNRIICRYITVWSKSSKFIIIWCYLGIGFCLIMSRFALSYIN